MKYDHILIRYGEIGLKGNNRKYFLNKLHQNINQKIKNFSNVRVKRTQGRLFIVLNGHDPEPIIEKCKNIFGIYSLSLAIRANNTLEAIEQACLHVLTESKGSTFKVSVRRVNKSIPHRSQDMNQILGSYFMKNTSI